MDVLFDDDELISKRFSCKCLFPGHVLDVTLELTDKGTKVVECMLNLYMDGKAPLKWRLKEAWGLLLGKDGELGDFILREQDIPELIKVLSRVILPYSTETVSNYPTTFTEV
jgi:hypothetical protein